MGKPAEIKTKQTDSSVEDFIAKVPNDQKQKDSHTLLKLMEKASKEKPKMWGATIIGFGSKRYKSPASGREVDWFRIGFSPRKANMTVYLIDMGAHAAALKKLGKHKIGGGCLYINKLEDIDMKVLEGMVQAALKNK
jgi:peptide subunit release factor 1 (eRF1)